MSGRRASGEAQAAFVALCVCLAVPFTSAEDRAMWVEMLRELLPHIEGAAPSLDALRGAATELTWSGSSIERERQALDRLTVEVGRHYRHAAGIRVEDWRTARAAA